MIHDTNRQFSSTTNLKKLASANAYYNKSLLEKCFRSVSKSSYRQDLQAILKVSKVTGCYYHCLVVVGTVPVFRRKNTQAAKRSEVAVYPQEVQNPTHKKPQEVENVNTNRK